MTDFQSGDTALPQDFGSYNWLLILTGVATFTYAFAKVAQAALAKRMEDFKAYAISQNTLENDDETMQAYAGAIRIFLNNLHTSPSKLFDIRDRGHLMAFGTHQCILDGFIAASKIQGKLRFVATTSFNKYPGVESFLRRNNVIPVKFTSAGGTSKETNPLQEASDALDEGISVAFCPEGDILDTKKPPHVIQAGIARLAIQKQIPIDVFHLDNYWWSKNWWIPNLVKNAFLFKMFLCIFHPNDVEMNYCHEVTVHLQPENQELTEAQLTRLICAEVFEFYRHRDLTPKEIEAIKAEISDDSHIHLSIWDNRFQRHKLTRSLRKITDASERSDIEAKISKLEEENIGLESTAAEIRSQAMAAM